MGRQGRSLSTEGFLNLEEGYFITAHSWNWTVHTTLAKLIFCDNPFVEQETSVCGPHNTVTSVCIKRVELEKMLRLYPEKKQTVRSEVSFLRWCL